MVATVLAGLLLLLTAWSLANTARTFSEAESPPSPDALWQKGADGALAALAYGMAPLIIPLLPLILAYDALSRDRATGFMETAMSKPVQRWALALGRFVGIFVALSIPLIAIDFTSALLIQGVTGASVSMDFTLSFVGSTLLLAGLFLSLALVSATVLSPSAVSSLYVLLWIAFSVSSSAFTITAQYFSIVPLSEPQTFQVAWGHFAGFVSLYQGLMAPAVPGTLGFVVSSTNGVSGPYWSAPLGVVLWLVGLLVGYTYLLLRYPLR